MLNDPSRVLVAAASHDQAASGGHAGGKFWVLALGSVGVVFGGALTAGPGSSGGFRVRVLLPWA